MKFLPIFFFVVVIASVVTALPLATIFGRHVETRRITKPYPTFTVHEPNFHGVCCPYDEAVSGLGVDYMCDTCLTVTYFSSPTRPLLSIRELLRDFIILPQRRP